VRWALARSALVAAATVATVLVISVIVWTWHDKRQMSMVDDQAQADSVAAIFVTPQQDDTLRRVIARTPAGAEGRLAVHFTDGRTLGTSRATADDVRRALAQGRPITVTVPGFRSYLVPVDTSVQQAVVEVCTPDGLATDGIGARLALLVLVGLCSIGFAVALVDRRSRKLATAVGQLRDVATVLGVHTAPPTMPATTPRELVDLGSALGEISGRLADLVANERELLADLSHRLRTPLTALRLDIDAVGTGAVADRIRQSITALEREVDDMIHSTRSRTDARTQECDPGAVIGERMAFWSVLARDQGRECVVECATESARIRLGRKELAAALDSLLVNVFRHTPAAVPFSVRVVTHAGWTTVVVDDGGAGIPDPEAALRRGASGGGSTGLGLDIARNAAETGGGTIHIERAGLGGARIRLRFPRTDRTAARQRPRAVRLCRRPGRINPHLA
jgi:signal transduction histidine kinase